MSALASWIVVGGVLIAGICIGLAVAYLVGADVYADAPDDEEPE